MITAESDELAHLRALLHSPVSMPREHLAALVAATAAAAGEGELGRAALRAESDWLLAQAAFVPELRGLAKPLAAALSGYSERCLAVAADDDVEALFEMAAARGDRLAAGEVAATAVLTARIDRIAALAVDLERVRQEADERWAEQSVVEDGQSLSVQVARLRATGQLLQQLGTLHRDTKLGRRARRSLRAADDRQLLQRSEAVLGHRGVQVVEVVSMSLLLVVLAVLILESLTTLSPATSLVLRWIDAIACSYFVIEFAFRLALTPRRWSWFLRHALTDLLPTIPAVLWLMPLPSLPTAASSAIVLRILSLFRITVAARYVQALRPFLRMLRFILLFVRGMDQLVRRFSSLLDHNFMFFETVPDLGAELADARDLVFASLRRQQVLCHALPLAERHEVLAWLCIHATKRATKLPGFWQQDRMGTRVHRDVPVEEAVDFLWALMPSDVGRFVAPAQLRALHRVIGVLHAPPFCWLPILRSFRVHPLPTTPAERVAGLAHRIASWLQSWHGRLQFFADLHGIVTGPQILDRVAVAMVKASQRPAIRLILFGGLFTLLNSLFPSDLLKQFVGTPLLLLGSLCLVMLIVGWWLKRIAGEASEAFRRTSEAHGMSLLHLRKRRSEVRDIAFLASRVFAGDLAGDRASMLLKVQMDGARSGVPVDLPDYGSYHEHLALRVALVYLHFLDGSLLHESDVKTTEQLLGNQALENLRFAWLGSTRKEQKRLKLLRLDEGTLLRGPFLWFRFITESISVETSKRITEYNRRCPPLSERQRLPAEKQQALAAWLRLRTGGMTGRTMVRLPPPDSGTRFSTSEFHAMDFLAPAPERDAWIETIYGKDVLAALIADRRSMIREIFGMRPVHQLPRARRTFNAYSFYWSRLSHGRVLLLPCYALYWLLGGLAWGIIRIREIVREVVAPHRAAHLRVSCAAPFAVALRKIHRMKAPGLLEAIRLRVLLDPVYAGAAAGWTNVPAGDNGAALERDLDFLHLREQARAEFHHLSSLQRDRVLALQATRQRCGDLIAAEASPRERADAELAITVAWLCDREQVRSLMKIEAWRDEVLAAAANNQKRFRFARGTAAILGLFRKHPVQRWLDHTGLLVSPSTRAFLRAEYQRDPAARKGIAAWLKLAKGAKPSLVACERLRAITSEGAALRAELCVLRAVQSLSVLDVRNYRDLVFELGGFMADGEDQARALTLP